MYRSDFLQLNIFFSFSHDKKQYPSSHFTLLDSPVITVSVDTTSMKKSITNDFEIITTNSISPSSISIINSIDSFTPLASPLYSTAIAYSPTTDIISTNQHLLTTVDSDDKQIYDLI
jgi:hypothetical protein